jgi:hypothetical protein
MFLSHFQQGIDERIEAILHAIFLREPVPKKGVVSKHEGFDCLGGHKQKQTQESGEESNV